MKYIVCFFWVLCLLPACNKPEEKPQNRILFNDFEAVAGWGSGDSLVTRERAHSGKYAIKVDQQTEYSYAYQQKLHDIFLRKPKRLQVSAWIFGPGFHNGKADLVVQVLRPEKSYEWIFNKNISLAKASSFRKWVKVTREITLPDHISDTDELRLYLRRNEATQSVFADDLEVLLLE